MIFFNELIQSLFTGFGIFVLAISFIHLKNDKRRELIGNLTDSAIMVIRLAAIGYLLIWLGDLYASFQSEEEYYLIVTRLTGPYWFVYWIYPICYGIFPQLLWVKKIKKIKAIRIITAFLFLFALYIQKMIISIANLHRDYIPSGWTMLPDPFIVYDWLVSAAIFSLVIGFAHIMKLRFAK